MTPAIRLWYADQPPPEGGFESVWRSVRDGAPHAWLAFSDVDADADAVSAQPVGSLWRQVFPAGPVAAPVAAGALLVVFSRPQGVTDDEFNAWYDTDHLPPLMGERVPRVRRFHLAGEEYPYLALYEIAGWGAWDSHPGRAIARSTPWMARIRTRMARTEGYYSPAYNPAVAGGLVGGSA